MNHSEGRRIAKNSLALYVRMIVSLLVSLYTSRVVLEVLGIEDYGIYSLVGGVTAMMSFINASMSNTSSRFLSFELGQNTPISRIREVFTSAVYIHLIIAGVFILIAETVGLWFVANKINIPEESRNAAIWVYQFSILSSCIGIIQTPLHALIISKEKMTIYAYMEVANTFLKLGIVYLIVFFPYNKLITYAFLFFLSSLLIAVIYYIYCFKNFKDSRLIRLSDYGFIRPMLSFSGWNLIGDIGFTLRQNGSNIILNIFFGAIINAANGIAQTIQSALMGLSINVITALRPPIIKKYSSGDSQTASKMLFSGSVLALGIMCAIMGPVIININTILNFWLKDVPPYTASFTIVCLAAGAISCSSNVLYIGLQAAARIKTLNLVRLIVYSASIFILYMLLKNGFPPITAYLLVCLALYLTQAVNIFLLRRICNPRDCFVTLWRLTYIMFICAIDIVIVNLLFSSINETLCRFLLSSISYIILFIISFYLFCLNKDERSVVQQLLKINKWFH